MKMACWNLIAFVLSVKKQRSLTPTKMQTFGYWLSPRLTNAKNVDKNPTKQKPSIGP